MTDTELDEKFQSFARLMQEEGLPRIVIDTFQHQYTRLFQGSTGLIPEDDIHSVESLPDAETFSEELNTYGEKAISETVVIKLNGGLGTGMGLNKAKSLIEVREGLCFLDIIARQAIHHNIPLLLMNSFATREDSLDALKKYPELVQAGLDLDFVQHKVPKIRQDDLMPVDWPKAPHLEWSPPGHGDIYTALVTSGMLDRLLSAGFRYAFVSNADNLGAVMDTALLGYFMEQKLPFMMEVADRVEADKKGGHLASLADGQLVLRESAQCSPEDVDSFQDTRRHKYFNTNNLWLNLQALKDKMEEKEYILGLSLIRNKKVVDPRDTGSIPVYQLETAMGSAISVFKGSQAVRVSRKRFAPVKSTNDLLLLRSDIYTLTNDYLIVPRTDRHSPLPLIDLDPRYYKMLDDFETRFIEGVPSLSACSSLSVRGDIKFQGDISLHGIVSLENASGGQQELESGKAIKEDVTWD